MNRLTKIDSMGQNKMIKCFGCDEEKAGHKLEHCGYCEHWQAVLDRLAAYENTEMGPEEIIARKELAEIACALNLLKTYQNLGSVEELSLLVKSREDGRLVVLPCKVGDRLYRVAPYGEIEAMNICGVRYQAEFNRTQVECIPFHRFYWKDDFGKTVFLTREEAEKALEASYNG